MITSAFRPKAYKRDNLPCADHGWARLAIFR